MAEGLESLVSGKRGSPRLPISHEARIKALQGEFPAQVVDLSLEGALISIPLAAIGVEGGPLGPAEQFQLLEGHFRDSFDLHVPACGAVIEAQVVRLLVTPEDEVNLQLGCRFVQPLSDAQAKKLGLTQDEDSDLMNWGEATLLYDLRWIADPAKPISALMVDDREGERGPLYLGPVAAVGKRALLLRLWDTSSEDVVATLGAAGVRARIMRGSTCLYDAPCAPIATRYIDTPRPGVEVLLACADAVPRGVRKNFKRA